MQRRRRHGRHAPLAGGTIDSSGHDDEYGTDCDVKGVNDPSLLAQVVKIMKERKTPGQEIPCEDHDGLLLLEGARCAFRQVVHGILAKHGADYQMVEAFCEVHLHGKNADQIFAMCADAHLGGLGGSVQLEPPGGGGGG